MHPMILGGGGGGGWGVGGGGWGVGGGGLVGPGFLDQVATLGPCATGALRLKHPNSAPPCHQLCTLTITHQQQGGGVSLWGGGGVRGGWGGGEGGSVVTS